MRQARGSGEAGPLISPQRCVQAMILNTRISPIPKARSLQAEKEKALQPITNPGRTTFSLETDLQKAGGALPQPAAVVTDYTPAVAAVPISAKGDLEEGSPGSVLHLR